VHSQGSRSEAATASITNRLRITLNLIMRLSFEVPNRRPYTPKACVTIASAPSEVMVSLLALILIVVVALILGFLTPPTRVKEESRFPKAWHGAFVVLLWLTIAFLGGTGFLGA
jgi:hypothetical protein